MKRTVTGGCIVFLGLGFAALAAAHGTGGGKTVTREALRWTGKIPAAQALRLRNVNGSLTLEAAAGDTAEIVATESKHEGDKGQITVQMVNAKDGVVFCAIFPGGGGHCGAEGRYDAGGKDNDEDLSVDFVVKVPKGVLVDASTVNGEVTVHGATARVSATTVNGGVDVESTGAPLELTTVNGRVRARSGPGDVKAETVNGSIELTVPAALDAEVRAEVVHGTIDNDFGLRADGDWGQRTLRGKVGKGTSRLSASTVNGSISIRKP
jgi:hypothetical protein